MKTTTYNGWHFLADDGKLRDGRDAPADGEWLHHDGALKLCESGLHWSKGPLEALAYAPGTLACRIQARGETRHDTDKAVSRERLIVWRVDAREVLFRFARACALDVAHLWGAPKVVVRWLRTGDPSLADEAYKVAAYGKWSSAQHAARSAATNAAWYAAYAPVVEAWVARHAAWGAATAAGEALGALAGEALRGRARAVLSGRQNRRLAAMLHAEHRRVS